MKQKIIKLPKSFIGVGDVKGFEFNQIEETETHYTYLVNGSYIEYFEKKITPICVDFKNRVYSQTEFKEMYPKSKDFGVWAWTKDIE